MRQLVDALDKALSNQSPQRLQQQLVAFNREPMHEPVAKAEALRRPVLAPKELVKAPSKRTLFMGVIVLGFTSLTLVFVLAWVVFSKQRKGGAAGLPAAVGSGAGVSVDMLQSPVNA